MTTVVGAALASISALATDQKDLSPLPKFILGVLLLGLGALVARFRRLLYDDTMERRWYWHNRVNSAIVAYGFILVGATTVITSLVS